MLPCCPIMGHREWLTPRSLPPYLHERSMGKFLHYPWEHHARTVMAGHNKITFITKYFHVDLNYFLSVHGLFLFCFVFLLISQIISTMFLNSDDFFRIGLGFKKNSFICIVKFDIFSHRMLFFFTGQT